MPKTKISEYSATANSNTDVASINIDEGCAPSGINNAIRAVMGHLKDFQAGTNSDSFNGPVGTTTAAAVAATTLTTSSTVTHNGGTANGVAYLNGSKVLTTGSALVFDGTNLGLGVTPSAWYASTKVLQNQGGALLSSSGTNISLVQNAYADASNNWTYKANGYASLSSQVAGGHYWYNAPSGTAGNAISFTQAMTLDASGYLLVGTTSSAGAGTNRFQLGGGATTVQSLLKTTTGHSAEYVSGANVYKSWVSGGFLALGEAPADGSTFTERARIDSSGNLLVGNTGLTGYRLSVQMSASTPVRIDRAANTGNLVDFSNGAGVLGNISTNSFSISYNTTSDYRLKENVQPLSGALARVAALKPCTYTWKSSPDETSEGFIAHELAEVCPQAVTGEKDAVDGEGNVKYQSIDTSFLVATLTAAIQEQQALITQLQADVAALKAA